MIVPFPEPMGGIWALGPAVFVSDTLHIPHLHILSRFFF